MNYPQFSNSDISFNTSEIRGISLRGYRDVTPDRSKSRKGFSSYLPLNSLELT